MVRRYDFCIIERDGSHTYQQLSDNGEYVAYDDYAKLEALIADAPHHEDCPRSSKHSSFLTCNCWKSRALDTGAKG